MSEANNAKSVLSEAWDKMIGERIGIFPNLAGGVRVILNRTFSPKTLKTEQKVSKTLNTPSDNSAVEQNQTLSVSGQEFVSKQSIGQNITNQRDESSSVYVNQVDRAG